MDYSIIKEKYPNSYNKYIEWNCAKNTDCPSVECYENNERDLYDFFDEYLLLLFIIPHGDWGMYYELDIHLDSNMYEKLYVKKNECPWEDIRKMKPQRFIYENRKDAEAALFETGFNILENIIIDVL